VNSRNAVTLKQYVRLKVQLNGKVVGCTELDKTQRKIGLLPTSLKVMRYNF
jgi:hypothetical protein